MKTTIDIPENELQDVIRYTKASTKKEAIITAVREFNSSVRRAELAKEFGTFKDFITKEELIKLRENN